MDIINWSDPDVDIVGFDIGGGEIYHYKRMPFTGILQEHYSSGILHTEIQCVNGYPEGVQREYYPNGQLMEELFIKYNVAFGIMRNWDENGNLLDEYDWGPEPKG